LLVKYWVYGIHDNTRTVNLSANGGGVTSVNSITAAVDITKPVQPTFDFVDTGLLDSDGITGVSLLFKAQVLLALIVGRLESIVCTRVSPRLKTMLLMLIEVTTPANR
jgi:hypothetical protein